MSEKTCFFVTPIGEEGSDVRKRSDQILNHLLIPVLNEFTLDVIRLDKVSNTGSINDDLIKFLRTADLVIADVSGQNPNVFFEMGYRTALGKPLVLIREKDEVLPFDITTIRTYDYDLSDLDKVENFKTTLKGIVNRFDFSDEQKNTEETITNSKDTALLYQILDSIKELEETVKITENKRYTDLMSTAMEAASKSTPPDSMESVFIKNLLPSMIQDPELFKNLAEMAQYAENHKRSNTP